MNRSHSPVSWRMEEDRNGTARILDADGRCVIETDAEDCDELSRGDLALIAAAVNAYKATPREATYPRMMIRDVTVSGSAPLKPRGNDGGGASDRDSAPLTAAAEIEEKGSA